MKLCYEVRFLSETCFCKIACFFGKNIYLFFFFFFQAEDGIRDIGVTGVQTCALPICHPSRMSIAERTISYRKYEVFGRHIADTWMLAQLYDIGTRDLESYGLKDIAQIGRASCRERV